MAWKYPAVSHVALLFVLLIAPASSIITMVRKEAPDAASLQSKLESIATQAVPTDAASPPGFHEHLRQHFDTAFDPTLLRACAVAVSLTIALVVFLYYSKGPLVIFKVIVYLMALSTIKAVVKLVQDGCTFDFPLFLTGTHFVSAAVVAFAMLMCNRFRTGEKMERPSIANIGTRFAPIALAFAGSVAMGNLALVYSTTAFVEIVGSCSPIFTVAMAVLMKQPFDMRLLAPCFVVFIGCALTSKGEPRFSMLGLFFGAGSNVPRAVKTVLTQMLLAKDAVAFSPLEVLLWTSVPSSAIMFSWSLIQEGTSPYHLWYQQGLVSNLTGSLLLSCVNATVLNIVLLYVIRDLGAVGTQIVAQVKALLVIIGGMCFLKEKVSALELCGFLLVAIGVFSYNNIESRLKEKRMEGEAKAIKDELSAGQSVKSGPA